MTTRTDHHGSLTDVHVDVNGGYRSPEQVRWGGGGALDNIFNYQIVSSSQFLGGCSLMVVRYGESTKPVWSLGFIKANCI